MRDEILNAATRVFAREGIAATRVEDLLVAAGVARRTFYKYFRSKEDVLASLHEAATAQLIAAIEAAQARAHGAPLAGIHHGIDIYLDFHSSSARGLRELVEIAMRADSQLAPRRRWMRGELVRVLDEAVQALDGRKLDPLVYHALVSALEGLSLHVLEGGAKPDELERARAVIHALVDQSLGVPSARPLPRVRGGRR